MKLYIECENILHKFMDSIILHFLNEKRDLKQKKLKKERNKIAYKY